ncbi:hypothetical protein JCM4814A_00300 [Streptomyces phaeofaciens JCM 4814]|uniref:Uncharacterized protein n=1 Tax=Streptomyces phaeofaciens TaxID=68254 RepID=A0A918HSX0_9ACTN|nr:hypothetical protein GCM10010226_88040 [Streptomyces phaeofaciens]
MATNRPSALVGRLWDTERAVPTGRPGKRASGAGPAVTGAPDAGMPGFSHRTPAENGHTRLPQQGTRLDGMSPDPSDAQTDRTPPDDRTHT